MAPATAPTSPGQLQRAASSEPCTTRPNPFDDNDSSSRKRQRTSLSGSPTQSVDAHADVEPDTSSPTTIMSHAASGGDKAAADPAATTQDREMSADPPQTPEAPATPEQHTPQTPSSRVTTINLRHANGNGIELSFPKPPSPRSPAADTLDIGVTVPELDLVQAPPLDMEASNVPSSASGSPPIEIITIPDDGDDDNEISLVGARSSDAGISIIGAGQAFPDPMESFPYKDSEETLTETLHRLSQYISTQPGIDEAVLRRVQDWLRLYIGYTGHVDAQSMIVSCKAHRSFWLSLPELIIALNSRKPSLLETPMFRDVVLEIYMSLSKIAASFIDLDCHILEHLPQPSAASEARYPELYSFGYLNQFIILTSREDPIPGLEFGESSSDSDYETDDMSMLLRAFVGAPSSNLDSLRRLAAGLIDHVSALPRLAEGLTPVCQMMVNILREFLRVRRASRRDVSRIDQQLKLGHDLYVQVAGTLTAMIEKQVTHLGHESTMNLIRALTEMLRICLHSQLEGSIDAVHEHQERYPGLVPRYIPEAASWSWRFGILGELIRSSQMQLRMAAVTTMCADLVALWKNYSTTIDGAGKSLLGFMGHYLLQSKLIDYIIGPSCHPEIIVESANIVGFLVMTDLYAAEHTDRLWQGITSSQDPRIADALTRMVTNIITLFDYAGCISYCEQLKALPVEAFTPAIRSLWDALWKQMMQQYHNARLTLGLPPYSLCLQVLRQSSTCDRSSQVAYPEMQSFALQKLDAILTHGPDAAGRLELYQSCVTDISSKTSTTLGSIWCLWMTIRPMLATELQTLIERHDLTRLIVDELEHAIKTGLAADAPVVLSGHLNLPRKELIMNIILYHPETLNNELGLRLWNALVGPQSASAEDRIAGWQIILDVATKSLSLDNAYLQTCLSQFLPSLPPAFFSDGMLDLIRLEVLPLVEQPGEFLLDDENLVASSGIEHLWHVIFAATNQDIVARAIHTLAVDIYIDSPSVRLCPLHRARHVHLTLVNRCLGRLKEAARRLKASSVGLSDADDEHMVIVAVEDQAEEQEQVFVRSLQLLRYFLEAHQSKPHFAAPDVRSLMSAVPHEIEGDLTHLKYQSFDGPNQTDVKPLNIGKLNTAASLLASLRTETGFENYRAYYRGHQFLPTEKEICQSLNDLHVHEGLILVRREEDGGAAAAASRIKPGSSPLEIEILAHFNELWDCLSMEENLSKEIYSFLIRLPAHGSIMELFESDSSSYQDVFPRGETFKSLYTIHALREYIDAARQTNNESTGLTSFTTSTYEGALKRSLSLVVQAISDETMFQEQTSVGMRKQLMNSFMHVLLQLLQEIRELDGASDDGLAVPPHTRLVRILSDAVVDKGEAGYALISNSLAVILRLGLLHADFWKAVSTDDTFRSRLLNILLFDDRKVVREVAVNLIEDTIDQESQSVFNLSDGISRQKTSADYPIATYFWNTISNVLPDAVHKPAYCHELFRALHYLLMRIANAIPQTLDLEKLLTQASELLLLHTSTETIDQDEPYDTVMEGLTSLCLICLQSEEGLCSSKSLPRDFAQRLFARHLFPQQRDQTDQPVPRVALNTQTRSKLCEIVFRLIRHDRAQFVAMLSSLDNLVPFYAQEEATDSPYHYDLPCPFDRSKAMRSSSGYVGLKNLSNTCYLNSLLTQLYMNPEFRDFVMSMTLRDPLTSQRLLFFTQKLFGYMQESYSRFVDPTDLVTCIRTPEDTAIDIHNQMDVDEFYSLLFDRWEDQLATSADRKRLRAFYGGQLVQQVKSKECEHISELLEPFSAIQCDIKGKTTLQESLQAYVDGEIMEGDNKYKCSTCDRHVDAVKRACLKDIPDNLIFHLKRFDFNLRTLQRSKINDYFSFPATIDMQPYTINHLSGDGTQGKSDIFELVGILVHSGTAESGHYYSYIRERPSTGASPTWVEYNDDIVTSWDPKLMETSTFGGPDNRSLYDANGIVYDKSYSAYMLFYQRASSLKVARDSMVAANLPAPLRVDVDPILKEVIVTENTINLRRHCLFDPSHATFVQQCFERAKTLDGEDKATYAGVEAQAETKTTERRSGHETKTLAMKMALGHLDQIVSRAKDTPQFEQYAFMIGSSVGRCRDCAFAFYDYFSERHGAFRALLQRNPEGRVRVFAGQTLLSALKKIASDLPHVYHGSRSLRAPLPDMIEDDEDDEDEGDDVDDDEEGGTGVGGSSKTTPVLDGTVAIFNYLWRFFHMSIRSWDEFFGTVLGFAKMGPREVVRLLADDYLLRTLRIVAADPALELPPNYVRMLHNVLRRLNTRAPSYVSIISLIDHLLHQLEPVLGSNSLVDVPGERLEYPGPTFPWTSDELMFIFSHPESQDTSIFLEKLLGIDQARESSNRIVGRLVATGSEMDLRVVRTLMRNMRGATSTQAMDPYLRAASTYLEHTDSEHQAQELIMYVCSQAKHLQNTEGYAFLDFVRAGLHLKRDDEEFVESIHEFAVETMADWVPHLLVYGEPEIRAETEELLRVELFQTPGSAASSSTPSPVDESAIRRQLRNEAVQRIGFACLAYLQDAHVKRKMQLGRDAATSILQVINTCADYFHGDSVASEDARSAFEELRNDVLGALRRLIVDEIEDDGSGWEGSYASSEPMEDFAELTMQAVKEANGMDTT